MHRGVDSPLPKVQPSTPAAMLTDVMSVMPPGKARVHRELIINVEMWQVRVGVLDRDRGEQLFELLRTVALFQVLPGDIRDVVCQSIDVGSTHQRSGAKYVTSFRTVSLWGTRPSPIDVAAAGGGDERSARALGSHTLAVGKASSHASASSRVARTVPGKAKHVQGTSGMARDKGASKGSRPRNG